MLLVGGGGGGGGSGSGGGGGGGGGDGPLFHPSFLFSNSFSLSLPQTRK